MCNNAMNVKCYEYFVKETILLINCEEKPRNKKTFKKC